MRWALGVLAALGLTLFGLHAGLERGLFTARIDAALEAALGRKVSLGPIGLALSARPSLRVGRSRIANLPGGSSAEMATIGRLEITLALRPLLAGRLEIEEIALADAVLLLERVADGRANWELPAGAGAGAQGGGAVSVRRLRVENAEVSLPGVGPLAVHEVALERAGTALSIAGRLRLRGEAVTLSAERAQGAWRAELRGEGLSLAVRDASPPAPEPWSLAAEAEFASAARLAGLLGLEMATPPLGRLHLAGRIGPGLALSALEMRGGAAELPGLRLQEWRLEAPALDRPMRLRAQGHRGALALALDGSLPGPLALMGARPADGWPFDATLSAGSARLSARGSSEGAVALSLAAPTLAPLLGPGWPDLSAVRASARLRRTAHGVSLAEAHLAAEELAVEGELEIGWAPRLALSGRLAATHLDLDALLPAGGGAATDGRVIPDLAIPVEALRGPEADLALTIGQMQAGGIAWRNLRAAVRLEDGRLELRHFAAGIPGGAIAGTLALDAAAAPPSATLSLRSQGAGLRLEQLRQARGEGVGLEGPAEIALELRGRGATTRELAASLHGEAGMAMVEGRLSRAGMLNIGPNLAGLLMPGGAPAEGVSLRCLALRLDARDGLAQSAALLVDSSVGRIEGNLAINLREETLAARLLPDIRVLGVNTRAPVGVGGTLAAPVVGVEPGQALAQLLSDTVANRLWRDPTVEWLRGVAGGGPADDCLAALRLARLGGEGRAPRAPAPAVVPFVPRELQSPVQDVLRGIGGLGAEVLDGLRR